MNAQEARDMQFQSRIILMDREIKEAASSGHGMVILKCVRMLTGFERQRLIDSGFDVSERAENFGSVIVRWHGKQGAFGPIAPEDEAAFAAEAPPKNLFEKIITGDIAAGECIARVDAEMAKIKEE